MPVDKEWVVERLREKGWSMRRFGREIGWDVATVSRALSGKRPFRIGEVPEIAHALSCSLQELLPRLGLQETASAVRVEWVTGAGGVIEPSPQADRVVGPIEISPEHLAIRVRSAGTAADFIDGWIMVVQPHGAGIEPMAIGSLALAETAEGQRMIIKAIRMIDRRSLIARDIMTSTETTVSVTSLWPVVALLP